MNEEEKKAIEYYQGKEVSFAIEGNMEELKKALGITDNEEDSFESHQIRIQTLLNLISKLQKELEQEKENNEKQIKIDTAEEVLKWKGKYHLLSRKINGVLEDKIKDKIKELEERLQVEYVLYEKAEKRSDTQYAIHRRINMINFVLEVLEDLLKEN